MRLLDVHVHVDLSNLYSFMTYKHLYPGVSTILTFETILNEVPKARWLIERLHSSRPTCNCLVIRVALFAMMNTVRIYYALLIVTNRLPDCRASPFIDSEAQVCHHGNQWQGLGKQDRMRHPKVTLLLLLSDRGLVGC
jgi:hypothetical protein